ncbi:MAG: hypothetical protein ABI146_03855 [Nitrobacter sp.]
MIAHQGHHRYFKESVAAAARFACVRVLTFEEPDTNGQFAALQQSYVHLSGASVRFELMWCLRRYFLMRDLFRREGLEQGWLLDSDLLLVDELPDSSQFPPGTTCALSSPPVAHELDRHFSPHCSFWTLQALESFCAFMVETYRDRGDELRLLDRQRRALGLTSACGEMILLGLWGLNDPRVFNLFEFVEGGMIDHNLRGSEQPTGRQLKNRFGNKVLHWREGRLFTETGDGQFVLLRCVHFQGAAKVMMPDFANRRRFFYDVKAWTRFVSNSIRLSLRSMKRRGLAVDRTHLSIG